MLIIRAEQRALFDDLFERRFIDQLIAQLRRDLADDVGNLSVELLESHVRYGIENARSHGLSRAIDLTTFVSLMFIVAPSFDLHPEIADLLSDDAIAPSNRMDRVLESLTVPVCNAIAAERALTVWPTEVP